MPGSSGSTRTCGRVEDGDVAPGRVGEHQRALGDGGRARVDHPADRAALHRLADLPGGGVGLPGVHPPAHVRVDRHHQHPDDDLPVRGSGCSTSTSRKSSGVGSPCGRAASCHSRVVTAHDPDPATAAGCRVPPRACEQSGLRVPGLGSGHVVLPVQDAGGLGRGRAARPPRAPAARARGPRRQRPPHPAALPRRHADRRLRRRLLLGRREGVLGDPGHLLDRGGLRRRLHARTRRTRRSARRAPGTPRPCSSSSTRRSSPTSSCSRCSGRTTTRPRACARATTSAPSTARRSTSRTPEQEAAALATRDAVPGAADGGRLRRHHHRDRAAGAVLLRRGLPPAVPLQGAQRLLPGALDGRLLPRRPARVSDPSAPMAIVPQTLLDQLRRAPDVEAPELVAVDATDRLLLDEPRPT